MFLLIREASVAFEKRAGWIEVYNIQFLAIQRVAQLIGFGDINTAKEKIQNTKIQNKQVKENLKKDEVVGNRNERACNNVT